MREGKAYSQVRREYIELMLERKEEHFIILASTLSIYIEL